MKRSLLVPEVVQTSAMDCGPACLKALLEGFGIPASYDRLREECQTNVDGASVDAIEQLSVELGLNAEQIMVPLDHVLARGANTLPALIVVRSANGLTHFVVVWRRYGEWIEVMDPAEGRQWQRQKALCDRIFVHEQTVPAAGWREWASSPEFLNALRERSKSIGVSREAFASAVAQALADPDWLSLAVLDAAIRMLTPMAASGALRGSGKISRLLLEFLKKVKSGELNPLTALPPSSWSVLPAPPPPDEADNSGTGAALATQEEQQLVFRGAVVLRILGKQEGRSAAVSEPTDAGRSVLRKPVVAVRQLAGLMRADGLLTPAGLLVALVLAAGGVILEAVLYRTFIDLTGTLGLYTQRLAALAILITILGVLLLLEVYWASALLRIGRKLEARFRAHLLYAITRLPDRYFGSRLISDMAERCHSIHEIRGVPLLGGKLIGSVCELILTTLGIIWLDARGAPLALSCALCAVALPLAIQPMLAERDLRFRTHAGGLCRFYLDALRGLTPVRAHDAADAVRSEHEGLLVKWMRAALDFQRAAVTLDTISSLLIFSLVAALVIGHVGRNGSGEALLLVYWALNLPVLGSQITQIAWQYPRQRNLALRLLEPLGVPEVAAASAPEPRIASEVMNTDRPERAAITTIARRDGVAIDIRNVTVRALGQTILEEFSLTIEPGSHVCIIGASGAGKSTLVGSLLGWYPPSTGDILIDGAPLDESLLEALRLETAWIDPSVQIWNRSLFENLHYGTEPGRDSPRVGEVIGTAGLLPLVEKLPDGLQTALGESGSLVSGGEAQRIRFGRALMRRTPRLVILDEPFTAVDRKRRHEFLLRAIQLWKPATMLCITHDFSHSRHFDRVLVLDRGRIVEDGSPAQLLRRPESLYRRMIQNDRATRAQVWSKQAWRRIRLEHGVVRETGYKDELEQNLLEAGAVGRGARRLEP